MSEKACCFCGSTDNQLTNEHLWPSWIRDLVPDKDREAAHTYKFENSDTGVTAQYPEKIFTATIKDVCDRCNNGWMSDSETRAQKLMSGVFQGRKRQLDQSGQATLAHWGTLKAMVAQRSFRGLDHGIPNLNDHYRELFDLRPRGLPDGLTVYTAQTGYSRGKGTSGFFRLTSIDLGGQGGPDHVNGYVFVFTVMDLAIIGLRSLTGERVEFESFGQGPDLDQAITRIWPTRKTFAWPSTPPITNRGLRAIAGDVT